MVAEMLGRRLHEALRAQPPLFNDAANFLRPVMVVADRSADVVRPRVGERARARRAGGGSRVEWARARRVGGAA
eukprot:6447546-Prymnesium_polylepis.1